MARASRGVQEYSAARDNCRRHGLVLPFRARTPLLRRSENGFVFIARSCTGLVRSFRLRREVVTAHASAERNGGTSDPDIEGALRALALLRDRATYGTHC